MTEDIPDINYKINLEGLAKAESGLALTLI